MNISVILPAAGLGTRFAAGGSSAGSKVEYELRGKAVFLRAADLFLGRADVTQVILAVDPDKLDDFQFRWDDKLSFMGVTLVAGGVTDRWETVQKAIGHVSSDATHIAVHDAARPLASSTMIDCVFAAAEQYDAVVPGLPVSDTLKRMGEVSSDALGKDHLDALFSEPGTTPPNTPRPVIETVPRAGMYRVQTPQVFRADLLRDCYAGLDEQSASGITDDAWVVEQAGHTVHVVDGDAMNLKLTRPDDAELLEAILRFREESSAKRTAEQVLFGDDDD